MIQIIQYYDIPSDTISYCNIIQYCAYNDTTLYHKIQYDTIHTVHMKQ